MLTVDEYGRIRRGENLDTHFAAGGLDRSQELAVLSQSRCGSAGACGLADPVGWQTEWPLPGAPSPVPRLIRTTRAGHAPAVLLNK